MEQELVSEGICIYCGEIFSQKTIAKHLRIHLASMEKTNQFAKNQSWHHIEVQAGEFFLHILVKGTAKMEAIDIFLRKIWLECCGHMSGFRERHSPIGMSGKVAEIFSAKTKIHYDYDYGTTTTLSLKAHKNYQLSLQNGIQLLSRNEPLKIMCNGCKKEPAVCLCAICFYKEDAFYCESCAAIHEGECDDFAEYANMPVVNSPRMGECGYTGGTIDLERDGYFKNPKIL